MSHSVGTISSRDAAGVLSAGERNRHGWELVGGLWVAAVTHYYLICLPVLLPAVWLGRVVNHRLHGDNFLKYVYLGLASIGAVLLAESVQR